MQPDLLSPAERLLLATCVQDPTALASSEELLGDPRLDWDELYGKAEANRVLGRVATGILALGVALAPERLRRWQAAARDAQSLHQGALAQSRAIGGLLRAKGLRPVLYKGFGFVLSYYPDPVGRGLRDLDWILPKEDFPAACSALQEAGFRMQPPLELGLIQDLHLGPNFVHPDHLLPADFQSSPADPYGDLPAFIAGLVERAVPCEELDGALLVPESNDGFLVMAFAIANRLPLAASLDLPEARTKALIERGGLVWVLDAVQWLRACSDAPRDELFRRAEQFGLSRAVSNALHLAHDIDPSCMPAWGTEVIERKRAATPWLARFLHRDQLGGRTPSQFRRRIRGWVEGSLPVVGVRPIRLLSPWTGSEVRPSLKVGLRRQWRRIKLVSHRVTSRISGRRSSAEP